MNNSRLQVNHEVARDEMVIVCLVEEYILSVVSMSGELLQRPIRTDAVLCTQLLPELTADLVAALANLHGNYLAWHRASLTL